MSWFDYLSSRLGEAINTPSQYITAYRFYLEETEQLSSLHGYEKRALGQLTLVWHDGAVSTHRIVPPLTVTEPLPLKNWRGARYYDQSKRYFPKQCAPLPKVDLFDDTVASAAKMEISPYVPCGFQAKWVVKKCTVAHSLGLHYEDRLTEAHLSNPKMPFSYHRRKWPDEQTVAYLETEQEWFAREAKALSHELKWNPHTTTVLFSPVAVRTLLYHGFFSQLTSRDKVDERFMIAQNVNKSSLSLRYDPLLPWSTGSFRFSSDGIAAKRMPLSSVLQSSRIGRQSIDDHMHIVQAIHWEASSRFLFQQWLPKQKEVLYVPELVLPATFSACQVDNAWVPQAFLFSSGRLAAAGTTNMRLSLAGILFSPGIQQIGKVGWEDGGIALPAVHLDATP